MAVIRSKGYSQVGAVFIQQSGVLLESGAWKEDLPFVSEIRLPASTYVIDYGDVSQDVKLQPSEEAIVDIVLEVAPDGSYQAAVSVVYEPLKAWAMETGLDLPQPATVKLEGGVGQALGIELVPFQTLGALKGLFEKNEHEVWAVLKAAIERGDEPAGRSTMWVKDYRPPPNPPDPPLPESPPQPLDTGR
jgi:hypothetical protein